MLNIYSKMPVILLDRLPLPSLRAYTILSVVLLSFSVYYAFEVSRETNWKVNSTWQAGSLDVNDNENTTAENVRSINYVPLAVKIKQLVTFMIQEPLCIWTLINMAYCCLILLGKSVQQLVFGELRVSEQQHIKDKFWNFVFYKFIFVFGVVNVQYMDEVVLWCSWFSVLGFLHLLAQLCKDRFEYLSFSPTTPGWSHVRLLGLLASILLLSGFMFLICVAVGFFGGLNTFAFMVAECVQLSVQTLQVMFRYALHLYDVRQGGGGAGRLWEKRGPAAYYAELVFELAALAIDLVHHLHMLLWSNIFLSMASLVICMQLRYLCHELQRRVKHHRNYLWVLNHMEQNYPMASAEELAEVSDNCAICWEKMESARKLPCSHLFHNSCLQSWLEQDSSCPTCRMMLNIQSPAGMDAASRTDHALDAQADNQPPQRRQPNHFFHFDGSRYVSWLPSFSVEVTHTQLLRSDQPQPAQTSQLDAMARQVQQLFPHLPVPTIVEDLQATRSVELTVENVLDGHVTAPPPVFQHGPDPGPPLAPAPSAHWGELCAAPTSSSVGDSVEPLVNLGGRFSKSSSERERILQLRKEQLLMSARRRYLERHRRSDTESSTSSEDDVSQSARHRHPAS
ncbi:E3 ubiquitin-protein ligase AMFR-like [Bacillus rossius redtenbacheri]|uniref:E3 ubiquitin-protein ligase AMFR-like n=1 Tax=Bacillus rossius redtenbacheri TaxID=93214 RepID=UPI002FDEF2C8